VHSNWTGFSKQIQEEEKKKFTLKTFRELSILQFANENDEKGFTSPFCRYFIVEKVAVSVAKTTPIKSILTKENSLLKLGIVF
jgi:hypothetical protein